ncbi:acetyl-CoA synthetase-like protein [Aureobasidium namibiae CBS 147.97]|uniref:Acetyl-CoA synthetase-like protein n=1 Tax=Aureobasidium namibiae CBS 147.97 TaxID=1043004 RepID=A0A074XC74_9PEZI|nr:acetyl-CoA synthetase-like protein [Aureobasidium namibiae CBS 147.97]KEQ72216.1 acetyl-CoA synthetase-like protein [Aureobasidium namibiae CBS 147.97]
MRFDPASFGKLRLKSHDSLYTIDDLIRSHAAEPEDFTLIGAPVAGLIDFEEHSARDVDRFANAAAARLQELGLKPANPDLEESPIIGMLCISGLDMVVTLLGLLRLGYGVLLLSTRLPASAYVKLMSMVGCSTLISTGAFRPVLDDVQAESPITLLSLLQRSDYIGVKASAFKRQYNTAKETNKIAVIIHSSGSTGFPKPIYLRHAQCLATFTQNFGMRAFLASPLFHSQGFYEMFRTIYSKKPLYLCNYTIPHTRQGLTFQLQYLKPEIFNCVPYLLKLLCESEDGIKELAKVQLVLYAGSGCPDDVGDLLVNRGVNLVQNYGCTEIGRIMTSFRAPEDLEWNYCRLNPPVSEHVLMDEIAPGVFECVALESLKTRVAVNSDDPPNSFRSRDLFAPHPTRPNLWKYLSRLDDRLTLVNGEKVLPLPIEGRIRQDRMVQEAAVFGIGRSVPGVIIFRSHDAKDMSDDEFFEAVWPAVEDANAKAESFSRVPKELVILVVADTEYPKTDKGTFIRAKIYDQFKEEIETKYSDFENGCLGDLTLEAPELEKWLLSELNKELGIMLELDTDFYQAGIDSLQSTRMWSSIKKQINLGGNHASLSRNVLYETANTRGLAQHLCSIRTGESKMQEDEIAVMEQLISKYSTFKQHEPYKATTNTRDVVLLTGATGTVGIHILAKVVKQNNVIAVWAIVRASSVAQASERISEALSSRGLHLTETERAKIVPFLGDLSKSNLGLDEENLQNLKSQLTHVIHSAWAVNFNLGVKSFEDQHIRGAYNLIQLCLSTRTPKPAKFFFCSSVSSAAGTPLDQTISEGPVPRLEFAQGTGYGRSKLVTERIVHNAMKRTGMYARVLRLGQIAGDSERGQWNTTEAIALMIQTATTIKALPTHNEELSWLPVDLAASVVAELSGLAQPIADTRLQDDKLVYNIQNPKVYHWTRDVLPALHKAGLEFDEVSPKEWVQRLRAGDQNPETNPPVKLADFFAERYGNVAKNAPMKSAGRYETVQTCKDSSTMTAIPDLIESGMVAKFVKAWAKEWGAELEI